MSAERAHPHHAPQHHHTVTARLETLPHNRSEENTMDTMYEALARERMREDQRRAAHRRQADRLVAQRRWRRVARFAQKRAERLEL